ncbi:MAG: AAA family ATPase [Cyanobacteria bacterium P01_D01_bin.156]
MLSSFQVRNFRLFQDIKVKKLSRVNLIVGKNNAGKSTFLEALELYSSNASTGVLIDLVDSRQENWFSELQSQPQGSFENPVRHLFFGHRLPEISERGILLGEANSNSEIHIGVAPYHRKYDDAGMVRITRFDEFLIDEDVSDIDFFLVLEEGGKSRRLFRLDRDIRDIQVRRRKRLYSLQEPKFRYRCQTVSTDNMPNQKLAELWDLTSLTDLESEVISALRLIDSRVSKIAFVEDSQRRSSDNRIPLVKVKGVDEPLPLKSMGDGMTRLFHIVVALVNAQDGLLLIDEFENGLHWSVQPKVWNIVFQLAERLNVQVFATTHSRDCVAGFDSAWNKYPNQGAFFRLDAKDGHIKVTEYTSETLTDAIEMDVEVR